MHGSVSSPFVSVSVVLRFVSKKDPGETRFQVGFPASDSAAMRRFPKSDFRRFPKSDFRRAFESNSRTVGARGPDTLAIGWLPSRKPDSGGWRKSDLRCRPNFNDSRVGDPTSKHAARGLLGKGLDSKRAPRHLSRSERRDAWLSALLSRSERRDACSRRARAKQLSRLRSTLSSPKRAERCLPRAGRAPSSSAACSEIRRAG